MKRIYYVTAFVLLCLSINALAQTGGVSIHSDPRLSMLLKTNAPKAEAGETKSSKNKKSAGITGDKKTVPAKQERVTASAEKVIKSSPGRADAREVIPARAKEEKVKPGKIKPISDDEREAHAAVSGVSGGGKYNGKGFRVQIYNGPNREEALRRKSEFMRNYPAVPTYLIYSSPCYKLKVGDFRRREDAIGMYHEANDTYSPCMIVPDMIAIH